MKIILRICSVASLFYLFNIEASKSDQAIIGLAITCGIVSLGCLLKNNKEKRS